MMQIPSGPKGTRDFYPDEIVLRENIFSSWHRTCRRYGFELFDAPTFEHLELYTSKSGEEIEKQLYSFQDKAGRHLALRPELTPSLARMVAARGPALKRPIRWYAIPRLFRYEKMQRGRLREFFQLNMDILGIDTVNADAELIAAVIDMMRDLGLERDDFQVHISSRTLLTELLTDAGVPASHLPGIYAVLDKKHKVSPAEFEERLARAVPDARVCKKIIAIFNANSLDEVSASGGDLPALRTLRELFSLLDGYGMAPYVRFDIGIVRGLAYYTGIVFELFDTKRELRAIAGGGRYDNLVSSYGGAPMPAVGFAAGDVVIGELLKDKGLYGAPSPRSSVFVVGLENAWPEKVIAYAREIRNAGISAEFALKPLAVGKQMALANAARASLALFTGGEEENAGIVKIKDMSSGIEHAVPAHELVISLNKLLNVT